MVNEHDLVGCLYLDNTNFARVSKFHDAIFQRKQSPVPAHANAWARKKLGPALPDKYTAGTYDLAIEPLNA